MMGRLASAILIGLVAPVSAQAPGETPAQPTPADQPAKSMWVAYGLSAGTLTAGMVTMSLLGDEFEGRDERVVDAAGIGASVAMLVAPSLGHWYAGRYITPGLVVRTAGLAGVAWMVVKHPHCSDEGCVGELFAFFGLMSVISGGIAWDLITIPQSVRRANARARTSVMMSPLIVRDGGGLAVAGTF